MEEMMAARDDERGSALVIVLLILALMLALTMAGSLTAISESGVANTYGNQTIALQAAESGLNHAASLVMNYTGPDFTELLKCRRPDPAFPTDPNKVDPAFPTDSTKFTAGAQMIVATNEHGQTIYDAGGKPMPATPTSGFPLRDADGNVIEGVSYSVRLIDDEPEGTPNLPPNLIVKNFNPGSNYSETINPHGGEINFDKNNRVILYSVGKYGNATVELEGWIAFLPFPALAANWDIEVTGSSDIRGAYGGVHSNRNLSVGNASTIAQSATAVGTATIANPNHVGGFSGGGQARLDIPPVVIQPVINASTGRADQSPKLQPWLIQQADRILIDPSFLDGAHLNDPQGVGTGVITSKSGRLRLLAERLNVNYAALAAAVDESTSNGKVDQTNPVAISITRGSSGVGTPTKITNLSSTGWGYTGGSNAHWGLDSTSASGYTYYIVGADNYNVNTPNSSTPNGGNVKITSNYGTASNPLRISILATGSIEIAGNPNIVSDIQALRTPLLPPFVKVDMLLAAVEDIKINGDTDGAQRFSGISYAGEQVYLSGNGALNGQVLSLGNKNVSGSPVNTELNTVTGSFELTLNNGNSIGRISLYTWRQIKR